uniref:Uncharacterized protein n=1 Tax=Rhizophora mucronata TaxID=61149 RepID=A0A2P2NAT0_RHIMU
MPFAICCLLFATCSLMMNTSLMHVEGTTHLWFRP